MTDDKQKTILCYGDSNTWGYHAWDCEKKFNKPVKRYSRAKRWPGVLQGLLADDYYVVEEGLNGRTTNVDYPVPPNRNGSALLPAILYSHAPIDLVVLFLGGNDLKSYFDRDVVDISSGLSELIDIIKCSNYGPFMMKAPDVLVLSQPIPLSICEEIIDEDGKLVFKDAVKKAKSLVPLYKALSIEKKCYFLDITDTIKPSQIDGIHLDETAHRALAKRLFYEIKAIDEKPINATVAD